MDETMRLIAMAHEGDKEVRDRLVMDNVGLIWSIIRRSQGRGYEMEDLFQTGSIGLTKVIDKFDMSYDMRFSTYAMPTVTGEVKRFLRDDGMIKVSYPIKEMGTRVKQAGEFLGYCLGREPTIEEIAKDVGASREEVATSIETGAEMESLYRVTNKNDESSIYLTDKIEEESQAQGHLLDQMVLKELLTTLGNKERELIIRCYLGNQTQTQIAQALDISQVQVSRMERKILKQLREQMQLHIEAGVAGHTICKI